MLDTETTGLEFRLGHRVIEIGCVEMVGRKLSGRRFHKYLNPQRAIDAGAISVHGLTDEFLADKPLFAAVVDEFIEFVRGAELVIHNAPFDLGFLDNELALLGREPLATVCSGHLDTLKLARETRQGKKNSLDALCRDFGVDNSGRQLHGALLDAELLAEVYLAMTRGQESLMMDLDAPGAVAVPVPAKKSWPRIANCSPTSTRKAAASACGRRRRRRVRGALRPALCRLIFGGDPRQALQGIRVFRHQFQQHSRWAGRFDAALFPVLQGSFGNPQGGGEVPL
jgi:DNA polymerase-3 subunit epsilon